MGSATWIISFVTISMLNVLLVRSQYSGWYGSQAYPGYGTAPIVVSPDSSDDLRTMLPILLLLLLDNFGGNGARGGCGCGCCCGNHNNNGNNIPIPYPIPIPVNNPVIA